MRQLQPRFFILVSLLLLPFLAKAEITTTGEAFFILCKRGQEIRFLRVEEDKPGEKGSKCTTYYSKEGHEKKVGVGSYVETCKSYTDKILDILKGVAWDCNPVKTAKVYVISDMPAAKPERLSESTAHENKQN